MEDDRQILHDIDAHDANVKHAEQRRAELGSAIGNLISGIAMNEVALELAKNSVEHQAVADEIASEITHGRQRIHELLDEAIDASITGFRSQHAQAELRAKLFPAIEE